MPWRAPKPCAVPGCSRLTHERYCKGHKQHKQKQRDLVRGSATQRGYGHEWRKIRAAILQAQPYCRCGAPATDVDHRIPLAAGGTNHPSNLEPMCRTCHNRKGARR
jgi:5-methylcytosine-specific restriction enzyme A